MHNYSNRINDRKALSNAHMELEPFKLITIRSLLIEIDILQWILNQQRKIFNNLNMLKEIVQDEIYHLRSNYNESTSKEDINILSKAIEILQTCLFLIKTELELYPMRKRNNNITNEN